METNPLKIVSKSILPHFHLILAIIFCCYVIVGLGLGYFYMETRCPYSSLTACQTAYEKECGSTSIDGADDCIRFSEITEPCYCSNCRFCLSSNQHKHCQLSVEQRKAMCTTQQNPAAQL